MNDAKEISFGVFTVGSANKMINTLVGVTI